jgi:Ran GTPase-activating protein 1
MVTIFSIENKTEKLETSADVAEYCKQIDSNKNELEEVCFSGNTIGVEASRMLAESLKNAEKLRVCNFSDMYTGRLRSEIPKSLTYFAENLIGKNITHLSLSDNAFGEDGLRPIIPLLKSLSSLHSLSLNNTGLGPSGGILLANALSDLGKVQIKEGTGLRELYVSRSRLEDGSMEAFSDCFQKYQTKLQILRFPQNGIRKKGMSILFSALAKCKDLVVVDVQDNTVTEFGSIALADALKGWENLKELNVGDCLLKKKGAALVCSALLSKPGLEKLQVLNLQYCCLDDVSGNILAEVVQKCSALQKLELNGNYLKDSIHNIQENVAEDTNAEISEMEDEDDEEDEQTSSEDEDSDVDPLSKKLENIGI